MHACTNIIVWRTLLWAIVTFVFVLCTKLMCMFQRSRHIRPLKGMPSGPNMSSRAAVTCRGRCLPHVISVSPESHILHRIISTLCPLRPPCCKHYVTLTQEVSIYSVIWECSYWLFALCGQIVLTQVLWKVYMTLALLSAQIVSGSFV